MEPDKRWMAQVYGKVRGESGLLFRSVFDALVELAVRGRDYEGLAALNVDLRVERLVERLLQDADATRWLSLASHLSPFAEAAPGAFIKAVEASLRSPGTPILSLFTESVSASSPFGGGAWFYADLLWAMELVAWSPRWIPRVASFWRACPMHHSRIIGVTALSTACSAYFEAGCRKPRRRLSSESRSWKS